MKPSSLISGRYKHLAFTRFFFARGTHKKARKNRFAFPFFFAFICSTSFPQSRLHLEIQIQCVCVAYASDPWQRLWTLCNTIIAFFSWRSCGSFFLSIFQLRACNYCFATRTRFVGREQSSVFDMARAGAEQTWHLFDVMVFLWGFLPKREMSENPFQFVFFSHFSGAQYPTRCVCEQTDRIVSNNIAQQIMINCLILGK